MKSLCEHYENEVYVHRRTTAKSTPGNVQTTTQSNVYKRIPWNENI